MAQLPVPPTARPAVVEWVATHFDGLYAGHLAASGAFVGGQTSADHALAAFDVTSYASRRNEVWPAERRGASKLSPFIRHGLLTLPTVWSAVEGGPSRDVAKFRDELLWQEYARHVYARIGRGTASGLRKALDGSTDVDPWPADMACVRTNVEELERDGWLVNQTRMWLASQWAVRRGASWSDGEDQFFRHLLDGSRAANRLGWQWTVGTATGRAYGFSRMQVEKRAPGLCRTCDRAADCPIESWPDDPALRSVDEHPMLRSDPDPERTGGPRRVVESGRPEAVWITAESLGDDDPALAAHPALPAVFVFDEQLLARLRLAGKRLVFLAECLADLAQRRPVDIHLDDPVQVLRHRAVSATFTPVPGWRGRASLIDPVEVHPWPWLRRPHGRSVASFSAWRKGVSQS